jgi:hypothetical protein
VNISKNNLSKKENVVFNFGQLTSSLLATRLLGVMGALLFAGYRYTRNPTIATIWQIQPFEK